MKAPNFILRFNSYIRHQINIYKHLGTVTVGLTGATYNKAGHSSLISYQFEIYWNTVKRIMSLTIGDPGKAAGVDKAVKNERGSSYTKTLGCQFHYLLIYFMVFNCVL
ncbi:hypothetical protein HanXRQr2_Chr07g0310791 [Helianthus annuus]|uniref:Uncharacterized protein n=1 Tax=Helianthus annuus TaxID=4232 RepID=A0A9K3NGY7_HELAN|nr:hypothetical protein HanXRQr2_Chr07g0310791 [Helianthus annuus]